MESDDDRHPLPEFTFHEACLLTLRLISQGLPDLHVAPAATVQEELQKRTRHEADAVVQTIKQKVGRFLAGLSDLNPSDFWDSDELRPKLVQDVFLGVKFYGRVAHITMAIQAIIYGALGIGILLHQRWGLILGLLYFAQVVIGHVIFFVTNFNVPSQAVHVKITAIEGPIVFLILLYLWIRSRPLLVHTSR
jgi:hypothetical protein